MSFDRQLICSQVAKSQIDCYIRYALEDILRIQPMIHRITLSGDKFCRCYDYDYFKNLIGSIQINKGFISKKRMPNYRVQLIHINDLFVLNIFISPNELHFPAFMLEITPKGNVSSENYKNFLVAMNDLIPNMKISKIEYAIDLYCPSPREVENLFIFLRRFLFIPYGKKSRLNGEKIENYGKKTRLNGVYQNKSTKIYERGDDEKKTGLGWNYKDLTKVRFEHTAKDEELNNYDIRMLAEFISNCRFHEIMINKVHFRNFKEQSKHPKYWDWNSYSSKDVNGNAGTFQNEYTSRAKDYKNIRQYIEDSEPFLSLKAKMLKAAEAFDAEWQTIT